MYVADMDLSTAVEYKRALQQRLGLRLTSDQYEQAEWDLQDVQERIAELS